MNFERKQIDPICRRLEEKRRFIQVIVGPRQVGKTALIRQALGKIPIASHYATADAQDAGNVVWLEQQWEIARIKQQRLKKDYRNSNPLLTRIASS